MEEITSTKPPKSAPTPPYWRIRDALADLTPSKPSTMAVSSHFDVETCLARIRRDKASVVRAAFNAAAMCVVQATSRNAHIYSDDDDDDDPMEELVDENAVPMLQDWKRLEGLRILSFIRARDNKDSKEFEISASVIVRLCVVTVSPIFKSSK